MWDLLILLGISLFYLVLQSRFILPPPLDDQLNYFEAASELPQANPGHQESRLGLLLPVRFLIEVFGYSEAAYYGVPILTGILLIAATYILGSLVFDRVIGVLAAILIVANPYVLWHSSHLLPDMPAAATLTLAIGVAIYASRKLSVASSNQRAVSTLFVISGLLLGVSYLIREFTPVFFGLVAIVLINYRVPWRRWLFVAVGALVPLSFEFAWNGILYGNPLKRILIAAAHGGSGNSRFDTEFGAVAGTLWGEFMKYDGGEFWVGFAVALALVPVVLALTRRKIGDGWILVAWVIGLWVFMTALGVLPSLIAGERSNILRIHKVRYWYPLFPALVVGGLGFIGSILPRGKGGALKHLRSALLVVVVVAPMISGIGDIAGLTIWSTNGADHFQRIRRTLSNEGDRWQSIWAIDDVWRATTRPLPMYTRSFGGATLWRGSIRPLNEKLPLNVRARSTNVTARFVNVSDLNEGLIVFHPRAIGSVRARGVPPEYVFSPLRSWKTVDVSPNGELALFDVGVEPETLTLFEDEQARWQAIGTSGFTIEESRPRSGAGVWEIDLKSRERAFIMDGQAKRYEPPAVVHELGGGYARGEIEIASSVGGSITGSVPAGIPNGHRVTLSCFVYFEDGSRTRLLAVAAPFDRDHRIGFVCPAVSEAKSPTAVRVGIKAVGEATIEVGALRLWWERDAW